MATNEAVLMMLPLLPPGFLRMASIAYLQPHQTPLTLLRSGRPRRQCGE